MNITVSQQPFAFKPTKNQIGSILYETHTSCTLDDVESWIRHGHSLSANFKHEGALIKQSDRTYTNFISTPFVYFDIDGDVHDELDTLCQRLQYKPTIAYTTYRHRQTDTKQGYLGNRYRFLYVFTEHIRDIATYKRLYANIYQELGFTIHDACGSLVTQSAFGSNESNDDFRLVRSDIIYDIDEVLAWNYNCFDDVKTESINTTLNTYVINNVRNSIKDCNDTFEKTEKKKREKAVTCNDFMTEYYRSSLCDMKYLIDKYSDYYKLYEYTRLSEGNADIPYVILPVDYCEIYIPWVVQLIRDEWGEVVKRVHKIVRWKDGQGRRRMLFWNGIKRRIMSNDCIFFDELLYNVMYEFYKYYESDDISLKDILKVAERVWNADLDAYVEKATGAYRMVKGELHRRKYCISRSYCLKHGVTTQQANGIAQGMLRGTDGKIAELYNPNMTDSENLELFKAHGLKVSIITLKRWRQKHGITKYKQRANAKKSAPNTLSVAV